MTLLKTMKGQSRILDNINYGDFQLLENKDGSITKIFPDKKITSDVRGGRKLEKCENLITGEISYTEWDKEGKIELESFETQRNGKKLKYVTTYKMGKFLQEEHFEDGQCVFVRDKLGTAVLSADGTWKELPSIPPLTKGNAR